MNKPDIKNKIVGMLNDNNVLNYVKGSEMKDLWERSLIVGNGNLGVVDDVVLFVGESEEEVRCMCNEFLKREIDVSMETLCGCVVSDVVG